MIALHVPEVGDTGTLRDRLSRIDWTLCLLLTGIVGAGTMIL